MNNIHRSKRTTALIIFTIALILINVVTMGLIFFDIKLIQAPEISIEIDVLEINSDEAIIDTRILIENHNPFDLIVKDLKIITVTSEEEEITNLEMSGGDIKANQNRSFSTIGKISFDRLKPEILISKLMGDIGIQMFGVIRKTIPIEINVITSLEEILNNIAAPIITINNEFGEISQEGVDFDIEIFVENPNSVEMTIGNLDLRLISDLGDEVGNLKFTGQTIPAKDKIKLTGSGQLFLEIFNANSIYANISTTVGVKIAGINKTLNISTSIKSNIPDIQELLSMDTPTEAIIDADLRATLTGFVSQMSLEITNPNKIDLLAKDVTFIVMRIDDDEETVLGQTVIDEGFIGAQNSTTLYADIKLPYRKIFFSRGNGFLPDALEVIVRANITVPGIEKTVWIGVSGYQDLHIFRSG